MTLESDVSILIPTYKNAHLIEDTVRSALNTGAGEIIVSDNASNDGTIERLGVILDQRFKLVEQPKNIGLWCHHQALIKMATKPWIKFLHADDRLAPGALGRMVKYASPDVTLIWSNPTFTSLETGEQWARYHFEEPLFFSSNEIINYMQWVGVFLGTPSHMMVRKDTINISQEAWANDISADLIMGLHAALKGAAVCLPEGNIIHGIHPMQDGQTQGIELANKRLINTLSYLKQMNEPRLRELFAEFVFVESVGWLRNNTVGQLRRRGRLNPGFVRDLKKLASFIPYGMLLKQLRPALNMLRIKYSTNVILSSNHLP